METERVVTYQKNIALEKYLILLNDILSHSERDAISEFVRPKYPVVFIVGCSRSGSTLLHQWLSNSGKFAYPTNIMSRFYNAPYIGALIQEIMTNPELDYQGELSDLSLRTISFSSLLGKTKGALAPHGFHSFWRRFFHYDEIQFLSNDKLALFDKQTFLSELAAIEHVFNKPLAMKSLFLSLNIEFLQNIISNILILHIHRKPILNAQSLLQARMDYYGSIDFWYSYKPPEYSKLKSLNPYSQVAGQIYFINNAITKQLKKMDERYWLSIDYSALCESPEIIYSQIVSKLRKMDFAIENNYRGPKSFNERNTLKLNNETADQIKNAYQLFEKGFFV